MAHLVRKALLSNIVRRSFHTSRAVANKTIIMDAVPRDRLAYSEDTDKALIEKEKGPWKDLTKEERVAIYKAQFPQTFVEERLTENHTGEVIGITSILIAVAVVFFVWLKENVGPKKPRTLTTEWRDAAFEKMKVQRSNPIFGAISKLPKDN